MRCASCLWEAAVLDASGGAAMPDSSSETMSRKGEVRVSSMAVGDASEFGPWTENTGTGGIQEAIDALPPTGGTVWVQPGEHVVNRTIILRQFVTLRGLSPRPKAGNPRFGSTIRAGDAFSDSVLLANQPEPNAPLSRSYGLIDLIINGGAPCPDLVALNNVDSAIIERCHLLNGSTGVKM